jgi:hypothetical protein
MKSLVCKHYYHLCIMEEYVILKGLHFAKKVTDLLIKYI